MFGHAEILSYEEILRLAELAARKGITKIRLTGGEPLVRKDAVQLIQRLSSLPGVQDLSMTTNGILLEEYAFPLWQAGLKRINISMDSLDSEKYRAITRGGDLSRVWAGIDAARRVGLSPIKINVVAIAGFNDQEIPEFARLTRENPIQVRFIEFMPIGPSSDWKSENCLPVKEMKHRIQIQEPLVPLNHDRRSYDGPAQLFKFSGAAGAIGFISPMSDHFCNFCNRLRLTADGKLKTCLFTDMESDVKSSLRSGCSDEALSKMLDEAISQKPLRHGFVGGPMKRCHRPMVKIGG